MTNFDAALKEDYLPGVRSQFSEKAGLEDYAQKNTEDVEGRYARLALHTSPNGGIGSRGATGASLPTAGQQGYSEERISMRYHYGRIQIEMPVIEASKTDKGAFAQAVRSELKGLVPNMKRDINRQRFGTSDGVIAATAAGAGVTVIPLAAATTQTQMRQFAVNMVVDIGTVANPVSVASARTITAVNRAGKTITISGAAVTTAATDFVFRSGNGGSGAAQKELTGLRTIVDSTGTLFNVNPATVPDWSSTELANGGTNRTPTESLFALALQEPEIYGGESPGFGVTSYGVHRAYANQLTSQKRFVNTLEMKGGYSGLEIAAGGRPVPLGADRDCPENTAFFLGEDHFIQFEQSDYEWMDADGAVLSRVSGQPAYEATLYRYIEQATDQRNAHTKVADLSQVDA